MIRWILSFLSMLYISSALVAFDKVVIWGHKLHSHTHSYIHDAFFRAFEYLGYSTYHFDNMDDIHLFDFSNTLFVTEGQVDQNIPLREDCFYILHNCNMTKYQHLFEINQCMILQVYTDDVLASSTAIFLEPCIYQDFTYKILYMPWAADLLPHEIEANKLLLGLHQKLRYIAWGGTIWDGIYGNRTELEPFLCEAQKYHLKSSHKTTLSPQELVEFTQRAYMAPAIVGKWQKEKGYIPCRIFKNISYGQMGITNSYRVYELFNKKIVYDPNTVQLFYKAKEALQHFDYKEQKELMDFVKSHHTYINRIQTLLNFIEKIQRRSS